MIRTIKYHFIIAFVIGTISLFSCPGIFAADIVKKDTPVVIESETMEYNRFTDVYHFQGKVVITYGDSTLNADDPLTKLDCDHKAGARPRPPRGRPTAVSWASCGPNSSETRTAISRW